MFAHEILNHAMEEKENVACEELKSVSLGCMVDDVFRGRVKYVRKGKRNERKCCYKNLTRRYPSDTHESPIPSIENLSCITASKLNALLHQMKSDNEIPANWNLISNHQGNVMYAMRVGNLIVREVWWKYHSRLTKIDIIL